MKMHADIRVSADVTINDKEAFVLKTLLGPEFCTWFKEHYPGYFESVKEVDTICESLKHAAGRIIKARDRAMETIPNA